MRWKVQDVLECAYSLGLDPHPVDFHIVPASILYDIAARGIPGKYSHWSHGQSFHNHILRDYYKMGRIYELVINSNPSQGFLLDVNSDVINLMIIAHVFAHADFFKNNFELKNTDKNAHINIPLRASRIREYEEKYGEETVREIIDAALTIELYVNNKKYSPIIKEEQYESKTDIYYDILNIGKPKKEENNIKDYQWRKRFNGLPCEDLLLFLINEAPLDNWQKDILSIIREDGLYTRPITKIKTLTEGHASFFHNKIMHQMDLTDTEFLEYAKVNAGVTSSHISQLNPYWLGLKILQDVEKRFGLEKIHEITKNENDNSFIRNYLTEELVQELGLIKYGIETRRGEQVYVVKEDDWKKVRDGIIHQICGWMPQIQIIDKNWNNEGILLLQHIYDGRKLKKYDCTKVLQHLQKLWQKPVCLETKIKDEIIILRSTEEV